MVNKFITKIYLKILKLISLKFFSIWLLNPIDSVYFQLYYVALSNSFSNEMNTLLLYA